MYVILRRIALILFPLLLLMLSGKVIVNWLPKGKPIKRTESNSKVIKEVRKKTKNKKNKSVTSSSLPYVVLIDPGHGGDDPGHLTLDGKAEKDINLNFSFKLARAIRMKGIKVFLTRTGDYSVTLEERTEKALEYDSAIYISVHCAYSEISSFRGVEIFGLSEEQTNGELETLENILLEGEYESIQKTQNAITVENRTAWYIQKKLGLKKHRLKRRYFSSIVLPEEIPGLLLFLGYLSNRKDLKKLNSDKYIDKLSVKIASAVVNGVTKRIQVYPKVKRFVGDPFRSKD